MIHAWLGFLLLLGFYAASFGLPGRTDRDPAREHRIEQPLHEAEEGRVAVAPD